MCDKSTSIETEACSRCGGSGQFSYCQQWGTTCFKCGGKGITMSKRGAVANAYLLKLRSKTVQSLRVGEQIRIRGFSCGPVTVADGWSTVEEVTTNNDGTVSVKTQRMDFPNCKADSTYTVRVRQSPEDGARTLAEALAYQDTLTVAGKPRKVRAAKKSERIESDTI